MSEMVGLCELAVGEGGRVVAVECDAAFRRRLGELGLVVGGEVRCYATASRGRTAVYLTEGGLLALRRRDAARILCEREGK